ncbi:MAG: PepSY-associated TM helix domain-containing protein [Pseudomonadota bacterium]
MIRSGTTLRRWYQVHKWTSLISTLFVLIACVTGLPLIFHAEIDQLTGSAVEVTEPESRPTVNSMVTAVGTLRPSAAVQMLYIDPSQPEIANLLVGESLDAPLEAGEQLQFSQIDGTFLGGEQLGAGVMGFITRLHVELFAGMPGTLFLGVMSMVFLVSLISGVLLYAPFMRNRSFAVVRTDRGQQTRWFDLHNALGMVLLVWVLVVSATGVINTWASPLIQFWQISEMQTLIADDPPLSEIQRAAGLTPIDEAIEKARQVRPGELFFGVFPGTELSSDRHYLLFFIGNEPLSSRLFLPVIINAYSGAVVAAPDMPWYINTLLLSQPLHFGDYGGLLFKIMWALLDVGTIVLLWSGLVLWWRKRGKSVDIEWREPLASPA